jgi:cytochrome c553
MTITTKSAVLAALALVACTPSTADTKPLEPPPSKRVERDMVRFHMHQNFDLLRAIERLLIRGKLDDARRFATAIATAPDEPAHGPFATYTTVVRERASAVSQATELDDAIRKVAKLGAACGNCHGELAVNLELDKYPNAPPDTGTLDARMARHRWAADRLWEGVVGNSPTPWRAGLDVLSATPLEEPADRAALGRQLQRLADQARRPSAGPLVDRATTYGEILVLCASCHTQPIRPR